jgi:predicted ATPase/class 3 adenylate cyclase
MSLPTGTVTFLFTDIEGSTRLWQQHPGPMKDALLRHHALLQQTIESSNGYVFQIVGDAFCAAFHTASEGVAAAIAVQRTLAGEPWGGTGPIRVRMALHTGTADLHAGEYKSGEYMSGLTLSHTARLLSVAYGGQILVSNATKELVRNDLPSLMELRDLGLHRLRDLARAEHIYQVVARDLLDVFPALKSLEVVPNNLPRQLTTFIGRERLIAEAKCLLAETHLLTITGPGGSGKTRLSLEIAASLLTEYPDGVWLVEFAPLADPARVPQLLATTLGVREEAGRPLVTTLTDHLRSKRVLLLLDNCEHLVDACARLADALLRDCPGITILPSSREALGLPGEVAFHVPPLSLPDSRHVVPPERFAEYEAIRLFIDRAVAVRPDFTLTDETASAVVQICRRLDGIPLAVELAAARARTLSVQQITAHLDERFRLLTSGSRTALPRHQTLRGLIDWSYGLLSEAERGLFRRVSVFAGGWTLGASVMVCAGDGVDRYDVVELLGRLVAKSLCLTDGQGSDPRYRLLETVREYGLEKLAEIPECQLVLARHRDFYLGFAEDAESRLQGPEQVAWLQRLEADHDNLRAALRWSLDHEETEPALRLGSALSLFWDTHGYVREGREWLDELLACARERATSVVTPEGRRALAKVLDAASRTRARWSEFPQATEFLTQGLAVWRELGDKHGIAGALNNLAVGATQSGDRARARVLVAESLALFRELSDKRGTAHALNNLADILNGDGDLAGARTLFEESVPLFESVEDKRGLSHALDNLGGILTAQGDYSPAEALYSKSLRLAEELGDNHAIATALRSLGGVAHHRGDHAQARSCYEDSVARFREMSDGFCLAKSLIGYALSSHEVGDHGHARVLGDQGVALLLEADAKGELTPRLNQLGAAALAHGDVARAARFFGQSLELYSETHDELGIATSLESLATAVAARGRAPSILRFLAAADARRRMYDLGYTAADRDACDRAIATARAQLDVATADAAWSDGASMTLDQAIALAREQQLTDLPAC